MMKRAYFLTVCAVMFSLLVTVQGYFAFHDGAAEELRAERIGAVFTDLQSRVAGADAALDGLSAYLTLETGDGVGSDAVLLRNGKSVGSFERGILTIRVADGDTLSLESRGGDVLVVAEYPEGVDRERLPQEIRTGAGYTKWGTVAFQ